MSEQALLQFPVESQIQAFARSIQYALSCGWRVHKVLRQGPVTEQMCHYLESRGYQVAEIVFNEKGEPVADGYVAIWKRKVH